MVAIKKVQLYEGSSVDFSLPSENRKPMYVTSHFFFLHTSSRNHMICIKITGDLFKWLMLTSNNLFRYMSPYFFFVSLRTTLSSVSYHGFVFTCSKLFSYLSRTLLRTYTCNKSIWLIVLTMFNHSS